MIEQPRRRRRELKDDNAAGDDAINYRET